MNVKNPFGLRNDKIVMIEDILEENRGLNCDCICPQCKEPFIAKLGEIRCHHFAHSGKGCDEINAYLTGMYMLLNEYLSNKNTIYLPPVIVKFELSPYSYITEYNIDQRIHLKSYSIDAECEELVREGIEHAFFDSSEIVHSTNGKPDAIIVKKNGRSLAIRIMPPSTVCKYRTTSKYKDIATLQVDLSGCEKLLLQSKKSEIFSFFENNRFICNWIYNPLVKEAYPRIIKRSKDYYDARQVRMTTENGKGYLNNIFQEMFVFNRHCISSHSDVSSNYSNNATLNRNIDVETGYHLGYEDVKDKFTQQDEQIRDRFDIRWIQCEKCRKIKPEGEFIQYGGNKINLGLCRDCSAIKRK